MNHERKHIFITGGNGHIASQLAKRYLQHTDAQLVLWLHADSHSEFAAKRTALETQLQPTLGRVTYCSGSLAGAHPFENIDATVARKIDTVVHAAAVTRFNVEQPLAQQVNVEGSEKLFRFCETLPSLQHMTFLSTVYTAGLHDGRITEAPLDDSAGFANHYEGSKWQAENILLQRFAHLPWQICRVATIIAEDDTGRISQYNAVHNTLKLLFYGLLPIVPGTANTPLYFVTSKFVTDALQQLTQHAPIHNIYHVTHALEQAITLDDFLKLSFDTFATDADFHKRRVIRPLYADQKTFDRLADSILGFGGAIMKQSVASVAPFSKQMFSFKDIRNDRLRTHLPQYRIPEQKKLVERICTQLLATRWNRETTPAPREVAA